MFLNEGCKSFRSNNQDVKTQLRFSDKDIEILTKSKGSTEPYIKLDYEDVMNIDRLPDFEYNVVWKPRMGGIKSSRR